MNIRVKRATTVADLAGLLNRISPDDKRARVIVDRPGDGIREPEYTVIWVEGDVIEP